MFLAIGRDDDQSDRGYLKIHPRRNPAVSDFQVAFILPNLIEDAVFLM